MVIHSWRQYTIMHLDRRVASIRSDGTCTIYAASFMPYNLYIEQSKDLDVRVNNLNNFYFWCASRVLTLDRKYAKEILNSIGARQAATDKERAAISLAYHCVTLTDVYWVKGWRERISYDEISLFDHSLSDAFVDVSLRGKALTAQNAQLIAAGDTAGDLATQGAAPKAWVRRNGTFFLLKDGDEKEVDAELLSSRIARCFDVDQVLYEPFIYDGQKVSASRLMTSRAFSIVPMEHVEIYAANHETDLHTMIRRYDLRGNCMMNIVDYLVGNTDRHWGNWGFLVDNKTNRPLKLFPLMDYNKAFQAYDSIEGSRCLTTPQPMSQMDAALEAVRMIGLNQKEEVRKEWFSDPAQWEMFQKRYHLLADAAKSPVSACPAEPVVSPQ
ncbi:MAG: hypothetical protein IJI38_11480 [Clostridia bacterium]|nr:hypothetical protein [Clostridia bacterium]